LTILYSKHAREKMAERGISPNEVEEGIKCGSKHQQYPDKIVSDFKYFSVVYKKVENNLYIITIKPRW